MFHAWLPLSLNVLEVRVPLITVTYATINHYTRDKQNMNIYATPANFFLSLRLLLHLSNGLEFDLRCINVRYIEFQCSHGRSGVVRWRRKSNVVNTSIKIHGQNKIFICNYIKTAFSCRIPSYWNTVVDSFWKAPNLSICRICLQSLPRMTRGVSKSTFS
jgi:hypothetical protein